MQNEFDAPAPGRFCRQQILAFLVLNILGSCVHSSPIQHVSQPQVSAAAGQSSTEPVRITPNNS